MREAVCVRACVTHQKETMFTFIDHQCIARYGIANKKYYTLRL